MKARREPARIAEPGSSSPPGSSKPTGPVQYPSRLLTARKLPYNLAMVLVRMANGFSRRQLVRPDSALAEMVLLQEILNTLTHVDPLHRRIADLFNDESESLANDSWNEQYDEVLVEARHRIV